MNNSLQNPHMKWNELASDDHFKITSLDRPVPLNADKRALEKHFNSK